MNKLLSSVLIVFLSLSQLCAQSSEKPWSVGLGAAALDFNAPVSHNYFNTRAWHGGFTGNVSRYLSPSFDLKLQLSAGDVWAPENVNTPKSNTATPNLDRLYDGAFVLKYKFDNGYIFHENALAAPYAIAGLGVNYIQKDYHNFMPLGIGVRFRVSDRFHIYAQSQYNAAFNTSSDYLQHSLGVNFLFGKRSTSISEVEIVPADSDGDGIVDTEDECPFAAGSAALLGCPDSDGDGIGDSRDNCPNEKGLAENHGCPLADRDNDGTPDVLDNCPDIFGDRRYKGCPDSDGDGVSDDLDQCVDVKGTLAKNGCPEEVKHTEATEYSREFSVYFDENSDAIRADQKATLDEAATYIKSGNYFLKINGYTSSEGSEDKNADLSMRRANNVYAYLASKGVKVYSTSYAWGENRPKYNNAAEDGKKKNRRVDIDIYSR